MITPYHQTMTLISFLCRRGLNPRSLIQLSEALLIKLTAEIEPQISYTIIRDFTN